MTDEFGIAGKTLLVTGSGRNLGKAVVLEFAARGANVVINARSNAEEANQVKEEAEALGAKAIVVLGDAAYKSTVVELRAKAEEAFGRVDVYVSNAARRLHKDFWETTDEDWHRYLNQQLTASWYLAKAFAPGMRERGWGRIMHMNGPDGWSGGPTRIPHSTAKGGLRTFTRSLARSLGPYGMTVNDINPGFADTIRDMDTHPGLTPELNSVLAIKEALADARIARDQLDGLITCKSVQGTNTDVSVGPLLGINPQYAQTLDYGTCNFSLHLAVQAILTGMATTVALCYGANARSIRFPFGASSPTLAGASGLMHIAGPAAMALQRHKAMYGTTDEQFGMIAVSEREWARKNPIALFREPMSMQQYLAMPYMVEPLRRADVTMLSDGGVSLIVTSAERATDYPNKPAYILGMSEQSGIRGEYTPDYLNREFLRGAADQFLRGAADQIWRKTGLTPADIDALYIQNPIAVWVLQMLEWYGFAPVGEAGPWLAEGHTRPGGDLPVNTNGGQLSESYMWGWLHLVEAVRQLRGQAGERQISGAEIAMYCSTQVWLKGGASILSTHN